MGKVKAFFDLISSRDDEQKQLTISIFKKLKLTA